MTTRSNRDSYRNSNPFAKLPGSDALPEGNDSVESIYALGDDGPVTESEVMCLSSCGSDSSVSGVPSGSGGPGGSESDSMSESSNSSDSGNGSEPSDIHSNSGMSSGSGSTSSDSSGSEASTSSVSGSTSDSNSIDGSGSHSDSNSGASTSDNGSGSGSISCSGSGDCKQKTEPEPCENSCGCNLSNAANTHGVRQAPVNLVNGLARVSNSYLGSSMGRVSMSYNNQYYVNDNRDDKVDVNFGLGNNWSSQQFAYLLDDDEEIYVNFEPENMGPIRFGIDAGNYLPKFGARATLALDNGDYRLTLDDGTVYIFDGLTGMIMEKLDTNDVLTEYISNGNNQIVEVRCQFDDAGTVVTELSVQ